MDNVNNGSRQTYTLSKLRQLIDLNGDTTNFDVSFKVVSKNGEPFDIVVVDQTTLDNNPELSYRPASNGQMSGNIIQDKNIYQNYFLVLKAEQPCECDVEIVKKELPKTPVASTRSPPQTAERNKTTASKSSEEGNWKFWIIVGVVVVGALVLYFIYRHDKKKKDAGGAPEADGDGGGDVIPAQSPTHSSVVSSQHSSPEVGGGGANDLIQRLKRLHMG